MNVASTLRWAEFTLSESLAGLADDVIVVWGSHRVERYQHAMLIVEQIRRALRVEPDQANVVAPRSYTVHTRAAFRSGSFVTRLMCGLWFGA